MSDNNNIFKELKKRKVFRSLAFYAGASFIILQVCNIVFPALLLPDWSMRLVVVLLIIGLPTLIQKDENRFRREATYDISVYLP